MFEKQNEKKHNKTIQNGEFFSMANFFRTRLRDSLRNGDEWGLSQNWQPCRRCHREERIFCPFFFLRLKKSGFSRPSKSIKRMVFLGSVDEANPQKCPGIPGEVQKSIAKIRVFFQLLCFFRIPTKIMIFLMERPLYSLYPLGPSRVNPFVA